MQSQTSFSTMHSLLRQRASAAARICCNNSSPLYRLTPAQALREGLTRPFRCPTLIEVNQRCYSITTVFRKQLPTSTEHPSSMHAGSRTSNPVSGHRSRKQSMQHVSASAAVSSGNGASAAAAVEPEPDDTPASVDSAVRRSEVNAAVAVQHRSGKSATGARGKPGKRGRRKQSGATGPRPSTPTTRPASSSATASAASKRQLHAAAAPPPVEPTVTAACARCVEGEGSDSSRTTLQRAKKVREARGKSRAASTSSSSDAAAVSATSLSAVSPQPAVTVAPNSTPSTPPSPSFGSPAPVYYTHSMMDSTPRTEEQRMAERCSITKLIMVSASVSFLFTTLPRSEGQLKMYVRDMNHVQLPATPATFHLVPSTSEAATVSPSTMSALTSKQFHELRQRLCAEQYATNTVFIHVREMEQLVPPLYLQPPPTNSGDAIKEETKGASGAVSKLSQSTTSGTSSSNNANGRGRDSKTRGRRGRRSRAEGAAATATEAGTSPSFTSSPAPPPLTVLSAVERLLALQEWKKAAVRRAEETQARYPIPAHFHAITRVRFHDPHQTDLTVAMGGGWNKSTESVLRAIVRSMHQEERVSNGDLVNNGGSNGCDWLVEEDDDEDSDCSIPPFPMPEPTFPNSEVMTEAAADTTEPEQPAFLASPYAVKPLLTVCASCVPRREAWIGTCSPKPSTTAAMSPVAEAERPYAVRPLPTVPRFSTRITIMLEHDEMDPADLVSLAEISTTRKPSAAATAAAASRTSSVSAFGVHPDVSVRGGGVDTAGGSNIADLGASGAQHQSCTMKRRPMQLYCLVQDAGEY